MVLLSTAAIDQHILGSFVLLFFFFFWIEKKKIGEPPYSMHTQSLDFLSDKFIVE